jgi:hypothetical protein
MEVTEGTRNSEGDATGLDKCIVYTEEDLTDSDRLDGLYY